ncbi:adenylate cyclase [Methylobacterium sp. ARG-1]|nr:adenylate cyclase [Methylobacterium sp. ARG-1]
MGNPEPKITMSNGAAGFWIVIAAISASFGALHGLLFNDGPTLLGVIYGACVGTIVVAYERSAAFAPYRERLRRLPTPAFMLAATLSLVAVIVSAISATGSAVWALGVTDKMLPEAMMPKFSTIPFALAVSMLLVSVLRVRDLIGSETFANFILGRYHRPVSEERIFLFLDLVGSTTYAERHGDLAAQTLLKSVFSVIAEPVRHYRGRVDDYVGDQVIISWPFARGIEDARCVACVFAIRRTIEDARDQWVERFGFMPELRAALHGGSIVTADIGVDRHKIAYFGDVMNATARLEGLCRETKRSVLVSEAVLCKIPALPNGIEAEALGRHVLRGRSGEMVVHALAERRRFAVVGRPNHGCEVAASHRMA